MRVLIVDEDEALGLFLKKGLDLEGYEVEVIRDGDSALERIAVQAFDLVVLDLSLPRRGGIEVLIELRRRCQRTAVLVLTGRSNLEEQIMCLNSGADDFVLKPFRFGELRARCKALLRRGEQFADPVLRLGGVELNRMSHTVTRDGNGINLTGKEFSLLEFLLGRIGQTCSRAELLREVWHMAPDGGTNVVDVYINYLRKKMPPQDEMASKADGQSFRIETVRGEGYMVVSQRTKKPVGAVRPLHPKVMLGLTVQQPSRQAAA